MPEITTIPEDIYGLFEPDADHVCNEENLRVFADNVKDIFRQRLGKYTPPKTPLRFSSLGKPDRQIWFDAHPVEGGKEALSGKTYLKFLYGDLIEQMLLFLCKEANHHVEEEQAEVESQGVYGHIDAIIDSTVVDVKSASPFGFQKFKEGSVLSNDPFGYVAQLAGYANVLTPGKEAAWLAMDKVSGEICISKLSPVVIRHHPPAERIEHLKKVIASDQAPELCYQPIPDGKSGNYKLDTGCSYCSHKFRCHPGLRTFIYSNGPRFLTTVSRLPDVPEVIKAVDANI